MRVNAIYEVICHQCGKVLQSESREMACTCAARASVEGPCVTRIEANHKPSGVTAC